MYVVSVVGHLWRWEDEGNRTGMGKGSLVMALALGWAVLSLQCSVVRRQAGRQARQAVEMEMEGIPLWIR